MSKFVGTATDRSFFRCVQKLINGGLSLTEAQDKYMKTRRPAESDLYDANKNRRYQEKRFYADEYSERAE